MEKEKMMVATAMYNFANEFIGREERKEGKGGEKERELQNMKS